MPVRPMLFFELIQIAIGNRDSFSTTPTEEEWNEMYVQAKRQALTAVCFAAMERMPRHQIPPGKLLRQWSFSETKIQQENKLVSTECKALCDKMHEYGFRTIILKGQGNMANYPEWLQGAREPGDIDVWMTPENPSLPPVRTVIEFCQKVKKGEYVYYHNLDFPVLRHTPVEVHYRPTWLFCPWRDRPLQKWFRNYLDNGRKVDYNGITIPDPQFNIIFQLLHIYKHIFEEGIGLRQLLDYYFVIQAYNREISDNREASLQQLHSTLRKLGLKKVARAVMYVLQQVFAMPAEQCFISPNEKEGSKILYEILRGGNFGHYDDRFRHDGGAIRYAWEKIKHNRRFLFSYPEEVIFEIPFRLYHWFWRTFRMYRY